MALWAPKSMFNIAADNIYWHYCSNNKERCPMDGLPIAVEPSAFKVSGFLGLELWGRAPGPDALERWPAAEVGPAAVVGEMAAERRRRPVPPEPSGERAPVGRADDKEDEIWKGEEGATGGGGGWRWRRGRDTRKGGRKREAELARKTMGYLRGRRCDERKMSWGNNACGPEPLGSPREVNVRTLLQLHP